MLLYRWRIRLNNKVFVFLAAIALSGCASEVAFNPELVEEEAPAYIAEAQIIVILPTEERELVFEGSPTTEVGNFTTLTVPLGQIMQEIVAHVFESCFMYGVAFTQRLEPEVPFVIAVEPQLRNFSYGYERAPDPRYGVGIDGEETLSIVTPQVEFDLSLNVYNSAGEAVLSDNYESGVVSGESYYTTTRPQQRINAAFHSALQNIMQTVADDIRPYLVGQCEITDMPS